jgi:hypothetical protein
MRDALYSAYSSGTCEVESYSLEGGGQTTRTKYRSLSELSKEIRRVESTISRLVAELNGTGVANMNLRRVPGYLSMRRFIC